MPHKLTAVFKIATKFAQTCATKIRFNRFFNGSKNYWYWLRIDKCCSSAQLQSQYSLLELVAIGLAQMPVTTYVQSWIKQALLTCSTSGSDIGRITSKSHPFLVNISVFVSLTLRQLVVQLYVSETNSSITGIDVITSSSVDLSPSFKNPWLTSGKESQVFNG